MLLLVGTLDSEKKENNGEQGRGKFTPTLVVTWFFNLLPPFSSQRVPTLVKPDVASISTSAFIILNHYHYHSESSYHQALLANLLLTSTKALVYIPRVHKIINSIKKLVQGCQVSFLRTKLTTSSCRAFSVPSIISSTRARQGFRVVGPLQPANGAISRSSLH